MCRCQWVTLDLGIWTSKERFDLEIDICELTVVFKVTEMDEILMGDQREKKSCRSTYL